MKKRKHDKKMIADVQRLMDENPAMTMHEFTRFVAQKYGWTVNESSDIVDAVNRAK